MKPEAHTGGGRDESRPYSAQGMGGMAWVVGIGLGVLAAPALAQEGDGVRQAMGFAALPALALASGALQAVLAVLCPRWTASTRAAVEERRGLCLLWGFLILLFVMLVTMLLSAIAKPLAGLGVLLVFVALLMSLAGYVGLAASFGARLVRSDLGAEERTPLQALAGGLALCFACLVPIVGQVLGLAVLFASIGAAAIALFRRPEPARPSPAE